jgi:hypothetical protein
MFTGRRIAEAISALGSALAIAVDFQNVYWTEGDAVLKVPSAGGAVTTLTAGAALPVSIAVDATSVYWGTNSYPMEPDFGAIVKLTPK